MGTTGIGIGLCYTQYNATANSYFSFNYSCVNDSGVFVSWYSQLDCSGVPDLDNVWVSLENTGWDGMNCGSNYDCVAGFTEYENENASDCDLDTASYTSLSVVVNHCFTNGTRSTKYSCYHGLPTKRDWYNDDCSGEYDDIGNPVFKEWCLNMYSVNSTPCYAERVKNEASLNDYQIRCKPAPMTRERFIFTMDKLMKLPKKQQDELLQYRNKLQTNKDIGLGEEE